MPFYFSFGFLLTYVIFYPSITQAHLVALPGGRGCSRSSSIHWMALVGGLAGAPAVRLFPAS